MKLKTSFFKGITLKKDILRFAPIWALYFIGMMLIIMGMGNYQSYDRYARNFMPGFAERRFFFRIRTINCSLAARAASRFGPERPAIINTPLGPPGSIQCEKL